VEVIKNLPSERCEAALWEEEKEKAPLYSIQFTGLGRGGKERQ